MAQLDLSREIYYSIVDRFLRKNKGLFTEYEMMSAKNYLKTGKYPDLYHRDILREIFDHLALLPVNENMYIAFMNEILKHYDITNKNIIEVGGGVFSNLAKRLTTKQTTGTITVFDPRLDPRIKSNSRMILIKDNFTRNTDVSYADLIIGLRPCKGIDVLLDSAIENKKDFMVWFCEGGPHGDYFDYFEDEDEWYHCMNITAKNGVERQKMGKIKKIEYPNLSKYPIIYNSREE